MSPGPAVFLGDRQPEPAGVGEFGVELVVVGDSPALGEFAQPMGWALSLAEAVDGLDERGLLRRQVSRNVSIRAPSIVTTIRRLRVVSGGPASALGRAHFSNGRRHLRIAL